MSLLDDVTIIMDGPDADPAQYDALAAELRKRGYHCCVDPGREGDAPEAARVWVGHQKGAERFNVAPRVTGLVQVDGPLDSPEAIQKVAEAVDETTKATRDAKLELEPDVPEEDPGPGDLQAIFGNYLDSPLQRATGSPGEPLRYERGPVHYGIHRKHGPHLARGGLHLYRDRVYLGRNRRKGRQIKLSPDQQAIAQELLSRARP